MISILVVVLIISIIILFYVLQDKCREQLTSKPTKKQIDGYVRDMLSNKNVFDQGQLNAARDRMDWIDPVIFESARILNVKNQMTEESLRSLF